MEDINIGIQLTTEHLIALIRGKSIHYESLPHRIEIISPVDGFIITSNEYKNMISLLMSITQSDRETNHAAKDILEILRNSARTT